jgi:hypothetical protein
LIYFFALSFFTYCLFTRFDTKLKAPVPWLYYAGLLLVFCCWFCVCFIFVLFGQQAIVKYDGWLIWCAPLGLNPVSAKQIALFSKYPSSVSINLSPRYGPQSGTWSFVHKIEFRHEKNSFLSQKYILFRKVIFKWTKFISSYKNPRAHLYTNLGFIMIRFNFVNKIYFCLGKNYFYLQNQFLSWQNQFSLTKFTTLWTKITFVYKIHKLPSLFQNTDPDNLYRLSLKNR